MNDDYNRDRPSRGEELLWYVSRGKKPMADYALGSMNETDYYAFLMASMRYNFFSTRIFISENNNITLSYSR